MTGYKSKKAAAQDRLDSMEREALKLALDWAEKHGEVVLAGGGMPAVSAMNAWAKLSKAALAQPEQEPVATIAVRERAPVGKVAYVLEVNLPVGIHKLYTAPPQRPWVGLTEKQIEVIEEIALTKQWAIRMTIAQLKECNT